MRIVIDLQGAQTASRFRGIGRYSLALALAMARQRGDHQVIIALNGLFPETIEPIRAAFDDLLSQDNIRVWDALEPVAYDDPRNRNRRQAAELLREAFLASLEPDLVCMTSLFEGLHDDAVASIGRLSGPFPTAAILYDLIPYIHQDRYLTDPKNRNWYNEKLDHLRRASLLLAISESSRQEALTHLAAQQEGVVTISAAADCRFQPVPLDAVAKANLCGRYGISRPFVMYTGGDDWRKNMDGLVRAYARLPDSVRRDHQLVIVCSLPPGRRKSLLDLAAEHGLSQAEIILSGPVTDDELVILYNTCKLFVFPSWHEGFGLPALEAMSCGAPVIGSNTTSIPEVIGRADAMFDPRSDPAMASKLVQALTDHDFRADLARHGLERAKAFSWDASARRAISAFERVHAAQRGAQGPRRREGDRPRLAYVSPWPPDRSGIADYGAELLPELSRHYDIELITSDRRARQRSSEASMPLRRPGWLRANAGRFDRVLYHFGNSEHHDYMFDLLADVPGTVVLHDFFLGDILSHREDTEWASRPWTRALYESHGYSAVQERFRTKERREIVSKYPTNLQVLQQAQGVIVHSNFAQHLAHHWYGRANGREWAVIPHLRASRPDSDRVRARAALDLVQDEFLVCCFGMMGPTKLNHRAINAWLLSSLGTDHRCRLAFVGENDAKAYGASIRQAIDTSGAADRIHITGRADPTVFRQYLAAADVAVQLRAQSRGETSGTVLDCMNHGLATIVNASGAMAELPPDAVWLLPETFSDAELVAALDALRADPRRRAALGVRAREVVRTRHDPRACADAYAGAIERFYEGAQAGVSNLVEAIAAQDAVPNNSECKRLAVSIARNHPALRPARRLFVDVSELVRRDAKSGIQRVSRNVLLALLSNPPAGFRVEPVYATVGSKGYRYARHFTLRLSGCPANWIEDDPIDPQIGDIFLGLDLNQDVTVAQARTLNEYRAIGVRVFHVIHDLLPVLRPDCFPADKKEDHARWLNTVAQLDGVIAVSRAVADELQAWLAAHGPERLRPLKIAWWHLGADIELPTAKRGLPRDASKVLDRLRSAPAFLMVGTIEPRKGHAQALSAFELLWSAGVDVRLVLVGKQGWMVDDFVKRMVRHPELGRRLFWLEGISDEYLEKVYAASTCLLAPSEAEGFGLPLIEAARHKLAILARDIPVFREVAGEHAAYFSGNDPEDLATAVGDWLALFKNGRHPRSDAMPWSTWQRSTQQLLDVIMQERWAIRWPAVAGRS